MSAPNPLANMAITPEILAMAQHIVAEANKSDSSVGIEVLTGEFLSTKIAQGVAKDTIEGYQSAFKHLSHVLPDSATSADLTQATISNYIQYMDELGLKDPSINRRLREIRTFKNWGVKRGIVAWTNIEIQQRRVDNAPVYISEKKMTAILAQMKSEHREFVDLFLHTGARLREIWNAGLQSDNFLVVSAEKAKGRREREIELSKKDVEVYHRLMASGLSPERLSRLFKLACVKAGYPEHHFHHIRHTAACIMVHRIGLYQTSIRLGHASTAITEKFYLRFSARRIRGDFPSLFPSD